MTPVNAIAQLLATHRRVGVLMGGTSTDAGSRSEAGAIIQGLEDLGWREDANLRVDYRWHGSDPELAKTQAAELVAQAPAAILAGGAIAALALRSQTRSVPIVFVAVGNPGEGGLVTNFERPEANITGFTTGDASIGAERLSLLQQIAPTIKRVAQIYDPNNPGVPSLLRSTEARARRLGIATINVSTADFSEVENALGALARNGDPGMLVLPGAGGEVLRGRLVELGARYRMPSMFGGPAAVLLGGLVSYGVDGVAQIKQATSYVDRILRGATISSLPVVEPAKFELVINLKTAAQLNLQIPGAVLNRADRVIQ